MINISPKDSKHRVKTKKQSLGLVFWCHSFSVSFFGATPLQSAVQQQQRELRAKKVGYWVLKKDFWWFGGAVGRSGYFTSFRGYIMLYSNLWGWLNQQHLCIVWSVNVNMNTPVALSIWCDTVPLVTMLFSQAVWIILRKSMCHGFHGILLNYQRVSII